MSLNNIIKKVIPKSVKQYIRRNLNEGSKTVEYTVRLTNEKRFANQRIIVTGATGAIGSAICHRLVAEGATVGICGRNIDKINELIERFQSENICKEGSCYPLVLDVTNDNNISLAIEEFVVKTGGLDAFVNNAGGGAREKSKPIHMQDIEIIDRVLNTNLRGSIICAREAARIMAMNKNGKIINMSSVIGMNGKAEMSDYAAAKAGIIGFTKSLALELGEHNITVNCISPGMVNQIPFDGGLHVRQTDQNCLGRFGYTDEVANLVAFILSKDADYITGHNFVIDGGRSLGLMGE